MTGSWPQLSDEDQRLAVLSALDAAGEQPDERFDRIARMATRYLNVPIALVSLIDSERQTFKAAIGLEAIEIPRKVSVCAHTLAGWGLLVVPDLLGDERFADFPVVAARPRARSYAGHPLVVAGRRVGAICVMDTRERWFDEDELAALIDLAAWAESQLLAEYSRDLVRELDELRRRTERVLEGVADGVIGVDAKGVVTFVNRAAEQMLDWPHQGLVGREMHASVHGRRADGSPYPAADCPVTHTLRSGTDRRLLRDVFWRRDGSSFPVDWSAGAVSDETRVVGAVVVFEDATPRVEIERIKDEFVSVVSHELRTPLTSLRGALDLLDGGFLGQDAGPDAQRLVTIAHSNARRLARLVDDILDLEKVARGDLQLVKAELDLCDLLSTAAGTVSGAATAAGVDIQVDAGEGVVWGDEHRLLQVLTNLLGNGVRFSSAGSRILLQGRAECHEVRLSVSDEGVGIATEMQQRVFDRFWQADASDTRARSGTGLGLAIAKKIVEAHGGEISVLSTVGVGSTFSVVLPQRRPTDGDDAAARDQEFLDCLELADRRKPGERKGS